MWISLLKGFSVGFTTGVCCFFELSFLFLVGLFSPIAVTDFRYSFSRIRNCVCRCKLTFTLDNDLLSLSRFHSFHFVHFFSHLFGFSAYFSRSNIIFTDVKNLDVLGLYVSLSLLWLAHWYEIVLERRIPRMLALSDILFSKHCFLKRLVAYSFP